MSFEQKTTDAKIELDIKGRKFSMDRASINSENLDVKSQEIAAFMGKQPQQITWRLTEGGYEPVYWHSECPADFEGEEVKGDG